MEIIVIIFIFGLYFLPSLNAYSKTNKNRGSVLVINLFLGWTFIGWVVALAMSASSDVEKTEIKEKPPEEMNCPFCHELIKAKAKICRFCNKDLKTLDSQDKK